jgi:hypothetical protein
VLVGTLGGNQTGGPDGHARIGAGSQLHMTMTGFQRSTSGGPPDPGGRPHHPGQGEDAAPRSDDFIQLILAERPAADGLDWRREPNSGASAI